MTDKIRINAEFVGDITLNQFKSEQNNAELKNGKVFLDGKQYSVKFLNGNVDVTRDRVTVGEKLKGLFEKHYRHTQTANSIRENILKDIRGEKIKKNTLININKLFVSEFGENATNKTLEIAHYGFSPNRTHAMASETRFNSDDTNFGNNNKVHLNTIDTYNTLVGITWQGVNGRTVGKYLDEIRNKNLQIEPRNPPLHEPIVNGKKMETLPDKFTDERLEAWKTHLEENAEKLDIAKKIFSYMSNKKKVEDIEKKSGWEYEFAKNPDKALKKFIQKNIPRTDVLAPGDFNRLTTLFKEYITIYNTSQGDERSRLINDFYKKNFGGRFEKAPNGENYAQVDLNRGCGKTDGPNYSRLEDLFDNVLRTAFFRQTSKLGLDFFRKRNVPILFQWSSWNGQTKSDKRDTALGDINNKWWLQDPSKFKNGQTGETITFSEARHLIKLSKAEQSGEQEKKLKTKLSTGSMI